MKPVRRAGFFCWEDPPVCRRGLANVMKYMPDLLLLLSLSRAIRV